jgi:DNA replication protein DnaC
MTAFLKIDQCKSCQQAVAWDWLDPVVLRGRQLPGTGVWRSALVDGLCSTCWDRAEATREQTRRSARQREHLIELLGGSKPYREFTFERLRVTAGNREASEAAKRFDPARENLYLWGPGRVGKTHLAIAIARTCFERGGAIKLATPFQLVRQLRMKAPDEEQQAIDGFVRADVLLLDDFGRGMDTSYGRLALQEILDGRDFNDRGGLVVTSRYFPNIVARRLNDDAIPSRLTDMCKVVEIRGPVLCSARPALGPSGGNRP